jgi:2-dehydro-3-deoxyphosphogluconate aldolase / (4S)-4-hydroxy-2-oxoglutarate aldolase
MTRIPYSEQKMGYQDWLTKLRQNRAIAVIRAPEMELGLQMAKAVADGGMELIEITWNSHRAGDLISQLRSDLPMCSIGTGTLLNLEDQRSAIAAGVQFMFTPHIDKEMISRAAVMDVPIIPGALTPTEIITAWNWGATCVKIFPVQAVGGANYIKCLQGPMGQIPLIPTGGVTLENAQEFLQAGAIAVGLSGQLFPKQFIQVGDWQGISNLARKLIDDIKGH